MILSAKPTARPLASLGLLLVLLPLSFIAAAPGASAELPPGAYHQLQNAAPEFIHIKVLGVRTRGVEAGTEVSLTARVTGIERSQTHLRKGAIIYIDYTRYNYWPTGYVTHKPRGHMVGPAISPLLEKGKSYPAFLRPAPMAGSSLYPVYEPAAYGHSFEIL